MAWELQLLHMFEKLHNPVFNVFAYICTLLGEGGIFWILTGLFLFFYKSGKYRKIGISVITSLALSLIFCNFVMKPVFHRIRPFEVDTSFENVFGIFETAFDWSFPSGHTSASFAAAMAIYCGNKKIGRPALVAALLVSLSRLYFTVHYPTDVLVSMVLGAVYGIVAHFIVRYVSKKVQKKDN